MTKEVEEEVWNVLQRSGMSVALDPWRLLLDATLQTPPCYAAPIRRGLRRCKHVMCRCWVDTHSVFSTRTMTLTTSEEATLKLLYCYCFGTWPHQTVYLQEEKLLHNNSLKLTLLVALKWHLILALCSFVLFWRNYTFLILVVLGLYPRGWCTYCKSLWIKASAKWNVM